MLSRNAGGSTVAVISLDIDDLGRQRQPGTRRRGPAAVRGRGPHRRAWPSATSPARSSGDEFVVVLERAHGEAQVLELADRLRRRWNGPRRRRSGAHRHRLRRGRHDHDRETAAEVLLVQTRTLPCTRPSRWASGARSCSSPHAHRAGGPPELRADLARAIDTEQFVAHYQPIVDLLTRRIVGCEALIRWQHPQRSLLSPPCSSRWPRVGPDRRHGRVDDGAGVPRPVRVAVVHARGRRGMTISVNLTAQEVHGERLVPVVTDILRRTGLPADRLVLEVTESNLLSDTQVIQDRMQRLRELGTRLRPTTSGLATRRSATCEVRLRRVEDRPLLHRGPRPPDQPPDRDRRARPGPQLQVRVVAEGSRKRDQEQALIELGCVYARATGTPAPSPPPSSASC